MSCGIRQFWRQQTTKAIRVGVVGIESKIIFMYSGIFDSMICLYSYSDL